MKMFREPLFDCRIKLAQSPLFDGPPLMCKPCRSPPIQRSQCRYVWNRLPELTTEMAQNRSRHIFQRSQCRASQAEEAELQGGTDPVSRSESLADGAPVASVERKPLSQQEFG
jgi:hypothetical protein